MVRICCCPGCQTGCYSDRKDRKNKGQPVPSLFRVPRNKNLFKKWNEAIYGLKGKLSQIDHVCALHFNENDIETHFDEVKLPDGKVWRGKKDKPRLKPFVVPSKFQVTEDNGTNKKSSFSLQKEKVFKPTEEKSSTAQPFSAPDCPKHESQSLNEYFNSTNTNSQQRTVSYLPQALIQNSDDQNIYNNPHSSDQTCCDITLTESLTDDPPTDQMISDENVSGFSTIDETSENSLDKTKSGDDLEDSDIVEQVSFDFIKDNVNMFETDNSWWRVNTFDDFVIFSRWAPDYAVRKRIVITKNLTIKVYLKEMETEIGSDLKNFSIIDIAKLIYRVDNLRICRDIDEKDRNCIGFTDNAMKKLCLNCKNWRKYKNKKIAQCKKPPNCIELFKLNLVV